MTDRTAAAYGVLLVVCALWGSLGAAVTLEASSMPADTAGGAVGGGFLTALTVAGLVLLLAAMTCFVLGVVAVRRLSTGSWAVQPVSVVSSVCIAASLALALAAGPVAPLIGALLALQTIALIVVPALARPRLTGGN